MFTKNLLAAVFVMVCGVFAFAQTDYHQVNSRLGVLPFTGGVGGDGEAVAAMFLSQNVIPNAFTVVPIRAEDRAAVMERLFRVSAFADSDTIADIGRVIGADYVLSGHIRRLGNGNLIIATVVSVHTFELVAGYYRTFRNLRELRGFMPSISRHLVNATLERSAPGLLPGLAVSPAVMPADVEGEAPDYGLYAQALRDAHDAETLAQILAIEMLNTGKYAVIPRATSMRDAIRDWGNRTAVYDREEALDRLLELLWGILEAAGAEEDYDGIIGVLGRAAGAEMVLTLETREMGGVSSFAAQIFRTADGSPLAGASRGYELIETGVNMMAEIALLLTDPDNASERLAALNRRRRRAELFGDPARFWSVGVSAGTSFAVPWAIGTVQATFAPFPFSFLRLGLDAGFVSATYGAGYSSFYPFAHAVFFMPFTQGGGLYAGAGGGFLVARYNFHGLPETRRGALMDFTVGVNVWNMLDVSYTLRTNFSTANGKVSVGFTHRFGAWGR